LDGKLLFDIYNFLMVAFVVAIVNIISNMISKKEKQYGK